jgi:hypothetical protein
MSEHSEAQLSSDSSEAPSEAPALPEASKGSTLAERKAALRAKQQSRAVVPSKDGSAAGGKPNRFMMLVQSNLNFRTENTGLKVENAVLTAKNPLDCRIAALEAENKMLREQLAVANQRLAKFETKSEAHTAMLTSVVFGTNMTMTRPSGVPRSDPSSTPCRHGKDCYSQNCPYQHPDD